MQRFAEIFVREEIELSTLVLLQEHHLEKIGITPLGPRLQLLNAITILKTNSSTGISLLSVSVSVLLLLSSPFSYLNSILIQDLKKCFFFHIDESSSLHQETLKTLNELKSSIDKLKETVNQLNNTLSNGCVCRGNGSQCSSERTVQESNA
jgi:hypothetical protein